MPAPKEIAQGIIDYNKEEIERINKGRGKVFNKKFDNALKRVLLLGFSAGYNGIVEERRKPGQDRRKGAPDTRPQYSWRGIGMSLPFGIFGGFGSLKLEQRAGDRRQINRIKGYGEAEVISKYPELEKLVKEAIKHKQLQKKGVELDIKARLLQEFVSRSIEIGEKNKE
jgi:hypothetical protein